MKTFKIIRPDENIRPALIDKINNLTKPKGSLGTLEELALQIGWIQQTLSPTLQHPQNIIFAADHGIVDEGVSLSPKEVTWQQISNFLHGGAGVNFLCRQHGFTLKIVDAGVDYNLPYDTGIIDMKVRKSTRNYLHEAAMTEEEMELCLERGAEVVRNCHKEGSNILSFGEMGIGNTSSSSLWMTCFTNIPLEQCVGAGSGLDNVGIRHKYEVLKQSLDNYRGYHPLFWRPGNGDGNRCYASSSRTWNSYYGRWIHYDKLYSSCQQIISGSTALCYFRTLWR